MTKEAEEKNLAGKLHPALLAMVSEFIATAEPVGSQQVASHYRLGVKSAMVRNMMGELEENGYLYQPHASAGRVPTEKGFRYYVDHLARAARIGFEERAQIELHYSAGDRDLDAITRDTPRLLALLTGQAALVTAPRLESAELERVNFVRLRERQVLAVFVARAGAIIKHVLATDRDATQGELDRMAQYLNKALQGRTLEHARRWIEAELRQGRARYDELVRDALTLGEALAERTIQAELYVEGSAKVLEQPEFADRTRTRELLRALEDKTALLDLLERNIQQQGLMVSIGSENYDPRLAGLAVVAAPYVGDCKPLGSLAVVGPMRMDYGRVIPLVEYTAKTLSRVLEH
jgi:heat-inducible transcriptional repressor